ncbi:N-acetylneuraminate lyase-like [Diachasmimorpha longicaudata]|uniref:N-acetylneuraminate lyase-like n=1 Tax=Diachasmimorpha longicaudata TaxID=58733 RepID=UPI0030B8E94A
MQNLSYTFRGFVVPVLTPFTNGLALNLSVIPEYAKFLAERGIRGVLVNGTSGEGMSMSAPEREHVAEAWANAVKMTKQHLMIQVGGAPLPDVIRLAKHAEQIKANAILCLPELYFKPTNAEQLINYLQIVGEAAPTIPLLYYHIPMFSNVDIDMGKFLESVGNRIPSFVGIKFTSTNLAEATQALHADGGRFVVFLGSDQIMSAGCAVGLDSFIPTSVNIFPEKALQILAAGMAGDGLKAREAQEKLNKAVTAIMKHGNWVVTMKTAMTLLTPINPGPVRSPIQELTQEAVDIMKKELQALGYSIQT